MAAPVSPDPRDIVSAPADLPPREIKDPRSETGVSTRRLRHLIGRLLDVAVRDQATEVLFLSSLAGAKTGLF